MKKPSMSELLAILNKPALLIWANKQGLLGNKIGVIRRDSMSDGSKMHEQIDRLVKSGECMDNEEHQKSFELFCSDKEIIECEVNIETEYFVGRYDCLLRHQGKKYLVDYKRKAKRVYLENKLQLVGYSMAVECDKFAIVGIPQFSFLPFEVEDRSPYVEIIKALSTIYKFKNQIENERTIL